MFFESPAVGLLGFHGGSMEKYRIGKRFLFLNGPARLRFAGRVQNGQPGQGVANLRIRTKPRCQSDPRRRRRPGFRQGQGHRNGPGDGLGDGFRIRRRIGRRTSAETDEELAPSPKVRRAFTRLQEKKFLTPGGGASAICGPTSHSREGTASKKHLTI